MPSYLVLAPHPDDAAYSLGGRIHQLATAGHQVIIYTVMGGSPPDSQPSNAFIDSHHARWNIGPDAKSVVAHRRREDETAAAALGAQVVFGNFPEALYRVHPETHAPLYHDYNALFGNPDKADPLTPTLIANAIAFQITGKLAGIFAPLAIGGHVDHRLAREVGLRLGQQNATVPTYFYEDYPYAREGKERVTMALKAFNQPLVRWVYSFDEASLAAKIQASGQYKSQLDSFWANAQAMDADLRGFAAQMGGEVVWKLIRED
jgi:LmbE family N-acetylglucosaminyl deacetylase